MKGTRYRFLLYEVSETDDDDSITSFHTLLTRSIIGNHLNGNLAIGRAAMPVIAGAGLYELEIAAFEREEPALFTQFRKYLSDDHWLGYVTRPNVDSNARRS